MISPSNDVTPYFGVGAPLQKLKLAYYIGRWSLLPDCLLYFGPLALSNKTIWALNNAGCTAKTEMPVLAFKRADQTYLYYLLLWQKRFGDYCGCKRITSLAYYRYVLFGALLMRSADALLMIHADRKVDGAVGATLARPIVSGEGKNQKKHWQLFYLLVVVAFGLVFISKHYTIVLSIGALFLG